MNIYICSTVRHLLFALCRANHEPHEQHYLLFFADYQGASLSDWNFADLPRNISVVVLGRREFRRRIEETVAGKLSYQYSRTLLSASPRLRKPVIDTLGTFAPELAVLLRETSPRLWLFNDRNRMARLFRMLTTGYTMMEDGESNYIRYRVPWWKIPQRMVLGQPLRYKSFGDDRRCAEVWITHPERMPSAIRDKARAIDFLAGEKTEALIRNLLHKFALPALSDNSVILATQPLDGMATMPLADKQRIYATIVDAFAGSTNTVFLKLHPAENSSDYDFLAGRVTATPPKVPIEALLLSAHGRPILLSVSSSAGLGFEAFCRRIKLIENNDFATMRRWAAQPAELRRYLEQQLAQAQPGLPHADVPVAADPYRAAGAF